MGSRHYPLRVTRSAFGIRAQDLRTLSRGTWWARRWIAALEAMRLGARFGRGRQYAVSGQVMDLVADDGYAWYDVEGTWCPAGNEVLWISNGRRVDGVNPCIRAVYVDQIELYLKAAQR